MPPRNPSIRAGRAVARFCSACFCRSRTGGARQLRGNPAAADAFVGSVGFALAVGIRRGYPATPLPNRRLGLPDRPFENRPRASRRGARDFCSRSTSTALLLYDPAPTLPNANLKGQDGIRLWQFQQCFYRTGGGWGGHDALRLLPGASPAASHRRRASGGETETAQTSVASTRNSAAVAGPVEGGRRCAFPSYTLAVEVHRGKGEVDGRQGEGGAARGGGFTAGVGVTGSSAPFGSGRRRASSAHRPPARVRAALSRSSDVRPTVR